MHSSTILVILHRAVETAVETVKGLRFSEFEVTNLRPGFEEQGSAVLIFTRNGVEVAPLYLRWEKNLRGAPSRYSPCGEGIWKISAEMVGAECTIRAPHPEEVVKEVVRNLLLSVGARPFNGVTP